MGPIGIGGYTTCQILICVKQINCSPPDRVLFFFLSHFSPLCEEGNKENKVIALLLFHHYFCFTLNIGVRPGKILLTFNENLATDLNSFQKQGLHLLTAMLRNAFGRTIILVALYFGLV